MKVIFLDIDGVLNCKTTTERWKSYVGLDQDLILIFEELVKKTKSSVVITSTWRLHDNWRQILKENGLNCRLLGRTPSVIGIRGDAVNKWLTKRSNVEKYAILDDDDDFYPDQSLFRTTFETGLTKDIANEIVKYFNEIRK